MIGNAWPRHPGTASNYFASDKNAVLFIAEVGGNHEGDFEYATRLADLGIRSGADVVKFQMYTGDTLVSSIEAADRNRHFKRFELLQEQFLSLAKRCQFAGVQFMASVWDGDMLEWIDPFIRIHKVGSGDLTCYPLIRKLMRTGKPIILSTGLASFDEIEGVVRFVERNDPVYLAERKLALLQCTSAYPCPDEDAHLRSMETLMGFGLPVGYSDHTIGALAVEAAVAMGAVIIEKHFTDTRVGKTFRDHMVSLTCEEIQDLLPRLRRISALRGSPDKALSDAERDAAHDVSFRRSVYAAQDIAVGETFSEDNLTFLRPAHGLPASRFDEAVGRTCKRALRRHEVLKGHDIE